MTDNPSGYDRNLPRSIEDDSGVKNHDRSTEDFGGDQLSARDHSAELLERARMQWQFGEWRSLASLTEDEVQAHAECDKLALLIGAAWQQLDEPDQAAHFVKRAIAWGCDRALVARVLVAGIHNTLARASCLAGQYARALGHFQSAVDGVTGDKRLACQARSVRESVRLGFLGSVSEWTTDGTSTMNSELAERERIALFRQLFRDAPSAEISELTEACVSVDDVYAAADYHAQILDGSDRFMFYCELSRRLRERKDRLTALHFLNSAEKIVNIAGDGARERLAKLYVKMGQPERSSAVLLEGVLGSPGFTAYEQKSIANAVRLSGSLSDGQLEHGHALLIEHLKKTLPKIRASRHDEQKLVLIEIGSTREEVPGQGSTRKLAEVCASEGIHFITVDMDPRNREMAKQVFQDLNLPFEAVTEKGEDFLRSYEGEMDFIFLDAYDFDHGKHSAARQSRYRRFLGSDIDDEACHQMHLECAHSIVEKLAPDGLVCVDDTWEENEGWAAKGTLAVPYLLRNGFGVVDARNRAALLKRL